MTRKPNLRPLALVAIAALSSGCGLVCPQNDCANPAVVVYATDAETGAHLDVVVEDMSSVPPRKLEGNVLLFSAASPASLRVSAQGYEPVTLSAEVEEDVCGDVVTQRRDVALQKLGSSQQAIVIEGTGEGC